MASSKSLGEHGAEATLRTIGVAIAIPDPFGAELQRWRQAFGDPLAASIPTHVTLVPPTPVYGGDLAAIEEHLRVIAEAERPFVMRLRGTGTFRPISPVVFIAIAEGIGACERVEEQVRRGPLERELIFPYHPHVTVAHDLEDDALDRAFKELGGYHAEFEVWGFSLFEHGPDEVWRPQRDFAFGAGGPGPLRGNSRPAALAAQARTTKSASGANPVLFHTVCTGLL